jgi:hypothetical protein
LNHGNCKALVGRLQSEKINLKIAKVQIQIKVPIQPHNIRCSNNFSMKKTILLNAAVHIRHQCRKTTVLSCHRCLINTGVENLTTFKYRLEL